MATNRDRRRPPAREIHSWAEIVGFVVTTAIIQLLLALATGAFEQSAGG